MEKPSDHIDKFTRKALKEGGLEKPSPGFFHSVMDRIGEAAESKIVYKPLIPKAGWLIVAGIIVGCMLLLYFYPIGELTTGFGSLGKMGELSFDNPLKDIELSKTMIYGLGCLGLFLFQIPILKRYLENNRV